MKGIIILNPNAHSGTAAEQRQAKRDEIAEHLRSTLFLETIESCETEYPGHARQLAENAVREGYGYIFAGGGDGTINEVLNGIMGSHLPTNKLPVMGVLPFGTSNDFFAALKAAESLHKLGDTDNCTLSLDVGRVHFDGVERYFCLTVTIGLLSWANEQYLELSKTLGRRFAHIPAAIKTILGYQVRPNVRVSIDGKHPVGRKSLSIIVNNSPVIAGGIQLTPDAVIDDGQFDVCFVKPVSLPRLLILALQVAMKAHRNERHTLAFAHLREMTITSKRPIPVSVDGELVPEVNSRARRIDIEIIPAALQIVVPSLCELPVGRMKEATL